MGCDYGRREDASYLLDEDKFDDKGAQGGGRVGFWSVGVGWQCGGKWGGRRWQ